jgi:hypothetical protein
LADLAVAVARPTAKLTLVVREQQDKAMLVEQPPRQRQRTTRPPEVAGLARQAHRTAATRQAVTVVQAVHRQLTEPQRLVLAEVAGPLTGEERPAVVVLVVVGVAAIQRAEQFR